MNSDSRPAHAAAIGPGILELGGRAFVLQPTTGPDMMAIHAEFRRQCLAASENPLAAVNEEIAAAEKTGRPFSPTVVKALVAEALAARTSEAKRTEPTDADILARLHTLDGSRFLVWYRLRRADPSVTREWVNEHVPDMDARNAILSRLAELDGLAALDSKKASPTG